MITDAVQLTGTITSGAGALKVTGNSTDFKQFPSVNEERLGQGDLVYSGATGVYNTREVDIVDDRQQLFYLKTAFDNALTTANFYRINKGYDEGIRFPATSVATSGYTVDFPLRNRRKGATVEVVFANLNASDGTLTIHHSNDGTNWQAVSATGLPITVANTDTVHKISIDEHVTGKYLKVVFTRGTNSAGTIRVNFYETGVKDE